MCCGFLALSPGCGGKEDPLTIPPFSRKPTTIQVGEVIGLDVELNRPAPAETTVEVLVEQSLAFAVQLEASRLVFAAGQRVQRIEMTGRNDTDGKFANVIFTISSNGARQIFQLKVDP